MFTTLVAVFIQGLSRSTAAAIELIGNPFGGIIVSDRFSAYNHLPTKQRQLCWAHLVRDLTAIAERLGASAEFGAKLLGQQQQFLATGTTTRKERLTGSPCSKAACQFARHLRPRCSGWWIFLENGRIRPTKQPQNEPSACR